MSFLSNLFSEQRNRLENPSVSLSDGMAIHSFIGGFNSACDEIVNEETALGVPAILSAIDFLSGSIAKLSLHVYRDTPQGPVRADGDPVHSLFSSTVNEDGETVYQWLRKMMLRLTLEGRAIYWIERNKAGRVSNIWPLDVRDTKVQRLGSGRLEYVVEPKGERAKVYRASEVLDFVYLPQRDGVKHYSPLELERQVIGEMIAAQKYSANSFSQGGIPSVVATMPPASPGALDRGREQIAARLRDRSKGPVMVLDANVDIKPIGLNHAELQMLELRKFHVLEVARIWNLPSAFLKDLSTGSFNNTEQQDNQLLKHSLTPWIALIEQELNSKLFGRKSTNYVKFNVASQLRGDLTSQAMFLKSLSDAGIYTKNEARRYLDMPEVEGGDVLLIQQQWVPLTMAGQHVTNAMTPTNEDPAQPGEDDQ